MANVVSVKGDDKHENDVDDDDEIVHYVCIECGPLSHRPPPFHPSKVVLIIWNLLKRRVMPSLFHPHIIFTHSAPYKMCIYILLLMSLLYIVYIYGMVKYICVCVCLKTC